MIWLFLFLSIAMMVVAYHSDTRGTAIFFYCMAALNIAAFLMAVSHDAWRLMPSDDGSPIYDYRGR